MNTKTINIVIRNLEKNLKEANQLKAECFAYQNLESWEYWHGQIEFIEMLLELYGGKEQ